MDISKATKNQVPKLFGLLGENSIIKLIDYTYRLTCQTSYSIVHAVLLVPPG
jgi:hypothetical protein